MEGLRVQQQHQQCFSNCLQGERKSFLNCNECGQSYHFECLGIAPGLWPTTAAAEAYQGHFSFKCPLCSPSLDPEVHYSVGTLPPPKMQYTILD